MVPAFYGVSPAESVEWRSTFFRAELGHINFHQQCFQNWELDEILRIDRLYHTSTFHTSCRGSTRHLRQEACWTCILWCHGCIDIYHQSGRCCHLCHYGSCWTQHLWEGNESRSGTALVLTTPPDSFGRWRLYVIRFEIHTFGSGILFYVSWNRLCLNQKPVTKAKLLNLLSSISRIMTHSGLIAATPGGRIDISDASLQLVDVTAGTSDNIAAAAIFKREPRTCACECWRLQICNARAGFEPRRVNGVRYLEPCDKMTAIPIQTGNKDEQLVSSLRGVSESQNHPWVRGLSIVYKFVCLTRVQTVW